MADTLQSFIERVVEVADKRNLAPENPVTMMIDTGHNDLFYIVVSHYEPNHVTLPMNVTWIVADPESPNYLKALRRASALPFNEYRNTWAELRTYQDFLDEVQFWDLSATFQTGEIEIPGTKEASETYRGLFQLNLEAADPADPQVAGDNDPRMSDARQPLPHDHPLLPATMLAGSTGINEFYVTVSDAMTPVAGEVLFLTAQGDEPGEWTGLWRMPVAADLEYAGATFDSLVINGTADGTLEEGMSIPFTADAMFSDGSSQLGVAAQWELIAGENAGTISTSTGVFTANDIAEDTVVRVRATWTHPESLQQRSATYDLTVIDTTIIAVLTSLSIDGATTVDEGGNTINYTVTAHYDNGMSQGISPATFTSSNPAAGSLDSTTGVFTAASDVTNDQQTTLTATYTEGGVTKSASVDLTVKDLTIYPQSAEIQGQATVNENTSVTYSLIVTFTDLTTRTVTVSDWALTNPAAGTIDPSTGELTAPINVDQDVLSKVTASYTENGRTVQAEKDITISDLTVYPLSAVIQGTPNTNVQITEGSTQTFQLMVSFSDGTTSPVSVSDWASSVPAAGTINATTGEFVASSDVMANTDTVISASFTQAGDTVSATFNLTVLDATNYPVSAEIVGNSSMNEGTTQTLILRVTYQDSTTQDVPATWSDSGLGFATVNPSGVVTAASDVTSNSVETITASYSESGVDFTETLALTVVDATVYPVSAAILGPDTISENTTVAYTLEVTYDDGTVVPEPVSTFAVDNISAGTITSAGSFTAPSNVTSNIAAQISASFTLGGQQVNAVKNITVTDETVYPASARIIGPSSIDEETTATYTFEVTWTDATVTTEAVSDWSSSNTAAATINNNTGVLTALSHSGDVVTTISASFTAEGVTVDDTHSVTILDTTNYPVGATIIGVSSVVEGGTATFELEVAFTDGTTQKMPATDWALSDPAAGVINATTGVFQADGQLTADLTVTVSASHTSFGTTVSDTHVITVTDETVYPVSAEIVGPGTVDENGTASYVLRVTFDDTSVQNVAATDWASTVPAAGTIDASTGNFTAATNDTKTNITTQISASWDVDGTSVTGTKTIGVVDTTPYLESAVINGPSSVNEDSSETYSLMVTYTDGSTAAVPATDWNVDVGTTATIDPSTGILTALSDIVGASTVTISASYSELGDTVSATKQVDVLDTVLRPVGVDISGPNSVNGLQTVQYTATVTYDDGSTATADVASSAWVNSAAAAGTITSGGQFTAADVSADTDTIVGISYTENGVNVQNSYMVTVQGTAPATAGKPRWGYAQFAGAGLNENGYSGPQAFIDGLGSMEYLEPVSGENIVYNLPDGNTFAYCAFPKSLGTAVFTDVGNGFPGGWDGAQYLSDSSNFGVTGPVEVTYNDGTGPAQWYVYRTDWAGPNSSPQTFRVDYANV